DGRGGHHRVHAAQSRDRAEDDFEFDLECPNDPNRARVRKFDAAPAAYEREAARSGGTHCCLSRWLARRKRTAPRAAIAGRGQGKRGTSGGISEGGRMMLALTAESMLLDGLEIAGAVVLI